MWFDGQRKTTLLHTKGAAEQQEQMANIEARCNNRFNAFVGNSFYVGNALDAHEAKTLLEAELWKFESLVDYIAGVAA